jgi:4-hydroxy-3-polyprenylbenzoate decarboxylase
MSKTTVPREDLRVLVAVTGASGAIYAQRLVEELLPRVSRIYLVGTVMGIKVANFELSARGEGFSLRRALAGKMNAEEKKVIRVFNNEDFFAPIASGSSAATHMVIVPSSMGTLARITTGLSLNLIERSADVMLKQKNPLIICPRETPFNTIHLRNMLQLAEMGVTILPPVPGFYQKPRSIADIVDFVVGRILEVLRLKSIVKALLRG